MKIALVNIIPPAYPYSQVMAEVIDFYRACLEDLGHQVFVSPNLYRRGILNIFLSWQFLPLRVIPHLSQQGLDYIILQLESLSTRSGWFNQSLTPAQVNPEEHDFKTRLPLLQNALQVWDYSPDNLAFLAQHGIQARLMPFGYHASLKRFEPQSHPETDVIFVGSLTPRRQKILETLQQNHHVKIISHQYGPARDRELASSKLILNIHSYPQSYQLEQVRLFYLFHNRCLVISEASNWNPYGEGLISYPYPELQEAVRDWLSKPVSERQAAAERSHQSLFTLCSTARIATALASL